MEEIVTTASAKLIESGLVVTVLMLNIGLLLIGIKYLVKRNELMSDRFMELSENHTKALNDLKEFLNAVVRSKSGN